MFIRIIDQIAIEVDEFGVLGKATRDNLIFRILLISAADLARLNMQDFADGRI